MKHLFVLIAGLLPLALFAQVHTTKTTSQNDSGIHFQHGLTWQQIGAKAKAEHKYIFMDCFTTWCGPCKYMSKTIFPQKAVGDAMNNKFIAVKMQLDTTAADNEEVKSMYSLGHAIATNYKVNVYPTYLFFDENAKLVHRAVGSSEADAFIAKTKEALNPETQYYTLLEKYQKGKKDSGFLHRLTTAALNAYDMPTASKAANDYIATQPNLYTKTNLSLLKDVTQNSNDKGFQIMLNNADKVDAVMGKGTADAVVQNIIMQEDVFPLLFPKRVASPKDLVEPNWSDIDKAVQTKYSAQAPAISAYSKVLFYMYKQDWDKFGPAVVSYMKSYSENASNEQLNQFAWTVFQNCSDETCLQNALEWSKRSFANNNTPGFMDTYANILYRLGKKDEALQWEQKAMDAAADGDKAGYGEVIEKMKRGDKTWN